MTQEELFKALISHAKEYGFIFPSSEIYDGLSAVYDYGQLGVELKNNIKKYWWDAMVRLKTSWELTPLFLCTPASGKLPVTWALSTTR